MATTCKKCDASLPEDANFCTECGQSVVDEPKIETYKRQKVKDR